MYLDKTNHMQKEDSLLNDIFEFLSKWWAWIFYVLIGMAGKFGLDMVRQRKMGIWQLMGSTCVSCFIGFLACSYCMVYSPKLGPFIVPIATLLSDRLILMLMVLNYKPLMGNFIQIFSKDKDDKDIKEDEEEEL